MTAWKKMKNDYDKKYHEYVNSFLESGKYKRYFYRNDPNIEVSEIFPYMSEDDIVIKFSNLVKKIASDWKCDVVIHGQRSEYVRKKKRRKGKIHDKAYRPDLTIYFMKKGENGVKAHGVEKAVIEIKFIGSTTKKKLSSYDWLLHDIDKLDRFVRRKKIGSDKGYFLCVDETGNAQKTIENKLSRISSRNKLGAYVFCPKYVAPFGKVWAMIYNKYEDKKIKRLILLKHAVVSELTEYFHPPTISCGKKYDRICSATLKNAKKIKRLYFENSKNRRGYSDNIDIYLYPGSIFLKSVPISKLNDVDNIMEIVKPIAKKIRRKIINQ